MSTSAVFVGSVVLNGHSILLVRQSSGHPLEGQWTVPWGRIEHGESPAAAALRETWEEGGVEARVEGLLGMQELPEPLDGSFALVYLCSHTRGTPGPRDRETDAARYFSESALDDLREPVEPWSEWLARRVFAGKYQLIREDASNPFQPKRAFL